MALVDANALLMDVLRPKLVPPATAVSEKAPADVSSRYPFVRAARWGGAVADSRFLDVARIQLDFWDDDWDRAFGLARLADAALREAQGSGRAYPNGAIVGVTETQAAIDVPSSALRDGETHLQALYELRLCPPS